MLRDIWTITSKEVIEYFGLYLGKGGRGRILVFVVIFGILLPLQSGVEGIESGASAAFILWMPFMLVSGIVVDAFAGERERHTLESLLATRISDQAILIGKILASVLYAFTISMGCYLISLIAINYNRLLDPVFYPPFVLFGAPVLSLLIAAFSSTLGVLISLRAPTARQAAQRMSIGIFVVLLPLMAAPLFLSFMSPEMSARIGEYVLNNDLAAIGRAAGLAAAFTLAAATLVLFWFAKRRFKRNQLILD